MHVADTFFEVEFDFIEQCVIVRSNRAREPLTLALRDGMSVAEFHHSPEDVRVAPDYPTEFSVGIAQNVGRGSPLRPYFIHRSKDDVVVGEIGGGFVEPGVVEIGYAVVRSCWSHGYATDAVRAVVSLARDVPDIGRIVAHSPLDRPASGRVLEKAGFTLVGEIEDEHEGTALRVQRWECPI